MEKIKDISLCSRVQANALNKIWN